MDKEMDLDGEKVMVRNGLREVIKIINGNIGKEEHHKVIVSHWEVNINVGDKMNMDTIKKIYEQRGQTKNEGKILVKEGTVKLLIRQTIYTNV